MLSAAIHELLVVAAPAEDTETTEEATTEPAAETKPTEDTQPEATETPKEDADGKSLKAIIDKLWLPAHDGTTR